MVDLLSEVRECRLMVKRIGDRRSALKLENERLRSAIAGIAPYLSASLDDLPEGHDGTYEAACNAVLACDMEVGSDVEG